MNAKNENINLLLGWVFILFTFFLSSSFSNSDSNSQIDSISYSVEQIASSDNSAIIVESTNNSNFDYSPINCELFNLKVQGIKLSARGSNNIVNRQFKHQEIKFFDIKPRLLQFCLLHLKISSDKDFLLSS